MRQAWQAVTFLHWPFEPDQVQRLLPDGLEIEAHGGAAWVGLVAFRIDIRPPAGPTAPWLVGVPETNVRTYVVGPDGRPGVWFFSLDIGTPDAAAAARGGWGLPYFWSRMTVEEDRREVRYRCRRALSRRPAASRLVVTTGEPVDDLDLTDFDHYLTARFGLWSRAFGRLLHTAVEHPPWRFTRVRVDELDDSLVTAAGLPAPTDSPVTHFSDGVQVRIGPPHRVTSPTNRGISAAEG